MIKSCKKSVNYDRIFLFPTCREIMSKCNLLKLCRNTPLCHMLMLHFDINLAFGGQQYVTIVNVD